MINSNSIERFMYIFVLSFSLFYFRTSNPKIHLDFLLANFVKRQHKSDHPKFFKTMKKIECVLFKEKK